MVRLGDAEQRLRKIKWPGFSWDCESWLSGQRALLGKNTGEAAQIGIRGWRKIGLFRVAQKKRGPKLYVYSPK